jgi:hypothetical protein
MGAASLWSYLAPADRETFASAYVAWLLDPSGTHGLGAQVQESLLRSARIATVGAPWTPKAEDKGGSDRRFDIALYEEANRRAVIEVKTKTIGDAAQLHKYSEEGTPVIRMGFSEWNWEQLDEQDKRQFPLVKFSEFADMLDQIGPASGVDEGQARSLAIQLRDEQSFFDSLRAFFEGNADFLQEYPNAQRLSARFYAQLFWSWFLTDVEQCGRLPGLQWHSRSEKSGTWCSTFPRPFSVDAGNGLSIPDSDVVLPGPFKYSLHLEVTHGEALLGGDCTNHVGVFKVHLHGEPDDEHRLLIYETLKSNVDGLKGAGLYPPDRRPRSISSWGSWTVIQRPLAVRDIRFKPLTDLVAEWSA